jgi:hypothetical protein
MGWDTLTTAFQTGAKALKLDEGSHKVILIGPDPNNRENYHPRIMTKHIARMLTAWDTKERWRNAHNLYRTMRLDSKTKAGAGWLLEPAFHVLCIKGTTFQLHPMQYKTGGRTKDTFMHSQYTTQESLVLPPQKLIVYDSHHPIESLQPGHYYQPSHGSQASFDSFIYDQGGQITMFQITDGQTHPIKTLGISFLLQLIERL